MGSGVSLLALAIAGAVPPVSAEEASKAGWNKPPKDSLQKIYGLVHALDIDDPKPLALNPEEWVSPFISNDGGVVYVATDDGRLIASWIASGEELWHRRDLGKIGRAMGQQGDLLLAGSGVDLVGLAGDTGKEKWRVPLGDAVGTDIQVSGTIAIVPVRPNTFVAIDTQAGKQLWRIRGDAPEGISVRGQAPAAIDARRGRVYLGFADGVVQAVGLEKGDVLWSAEIAEKKKDLFPDVDAQPALLDGGAAVLAASYGGGVARLDAANGRVIARNEEIVHVTGFAQAHDSRIVVASVGDGEVLGLGGAGGTEVVWRYKLDGVPTTPRSLGRGMIIAGATGAPSAILSIATGRPMQLIAPSNAGTSVPPAVRGDELAIWTNKGTLLVLRHGAGQGLAH